MTTPINPVVLGKTAFQGVAAMNIIFGNPKGDFNAVNWERLHNQCKNIADEINEYESGLAANDQDEQRDGLTDTRVFGLGGFHFIGFSEEHLNELVAVDAGWERNEESRTKVVEFLRTLHANIMDQIERQAAPLVAVGIARLDSYVQYVQRNQGIDPALDMEDVLTGVLTRTIKDEADKIATYEMHNAKHKKLGGQGELVVYYEGEYPLMVMKSGADNQPDAPRGKFLKSASYKKQAFRPLPGSNNQAGYATQAVG